MLTYFRQTKVLTFSLLVTTLIGCSSTKPVVKYSPNNAAFFLPQHADKQPDLLNKQLAYLDRGLVLDTQGRLMPANVNDCNIDMYFDISGIQSIKSLATQYSPLYAGLSLNAVMQHEQLYIDITSHRSNTLKKQLITLATFQKNLNAIEHLDTLVIDLSGNRTIDNLRTAKATIEKHFPAHTLIFKIPDTHYHQITAGTHKQHTLRPVTSTRTTQNVPYVRTFTTGKQPNQSISAIHYTGSSYSQDYRAHAAAVEITDQLLSTCRQFANFISPVINREANNIETDEDIISLLPQDADFQQLAQQKKQLKKGTYLAYNGQVKSLTDRPLLTPQLQLDRCAMIDKQHQDYQLCVDSGYQAIKYQQRTVVIGKKD